MYIVKCSRTKRILSSTPLSTREEALKITNQIQKSLIRDVSPTIEKISWGNIKSSYYSDT